MQSLKSLSAAIGVPYLERYSEQGGPAERIPLEKLPFTMGRSEASDHVVYSSTVSKVHAAIDRIADRYVVRDLGSTNGTFVNGQQTREQILKDGDIIHLAHVEFCFRQQAKLEPDNANAAVQTTQAMPLGRPDSLIRGTELLREMIRTEAVEILYQPIVDLRTREVIGFEALSRGVYPELSSSPDVLLRLAEQCSMELELSRLFWRLAVGRSRTLPRGTNIFINVHAAELLEGDFLESLSTLQGGAADHPIVIEIPEVSVTDVRAMGRLKEAFTKLDIEFAYDDFGSGQARLIELTDVPPAYLKFDKRMIDGITSAKPRQDMVEALLKVAGTLGVRVIAEGIETEEVAAICQQLGCDFGQGYLFAPPTPVPDSSTVDHVRRAVRKRAPAVRRQPRAGRPKKTARNKPSTRTQAKPRSRRKP